MPLCFLKYVTLFVCLKRSFLNFRLKESDHSREIRDGKELSVEWCLLLAWVKREGTGYHLLPESSILNG